MIDVLRSSAYERQATPSPRNALSIDHGCSVCRKHPETFKIGDVIKYDFMCILQHNGSPWKSCIHCSIMFYLSLAIAMQFQCKSSSWGQSNRIPLPLRQRWSQMTGWRGNHVWLSTYQAVDLGVWKVKRKPWPIELHLLSTSKSCNPLSLETDRNWTSPKSWKQGSIPIFFGVLLILVFNCGTSIPKMWLSRNFSYLSTLRY